MRNERAAADSRHARTGKDGAFYSEDGVLLATVDTFTSNVNWNNAKYSVLGDAQEHETANTFAVSLTMSQIVVEDEPQPVCSRRHRVRSHLHPYAHP